MDVLTTPPNSTTDESELASLHQDTLLQHLGEETKSRGAVVPPIYQNSLFTFDSLAAFRNAGTSGDQEKHFYSRISNPSLEVTERKIAMLEGMERCKLVGSGMSAITAAILGSVHSGAHVVTVDTVYGPVRELLTKYLARFGVTHTFVDGACPEDIFDAVTPDTSLIYLESPSSMVFRMQNLEAIGKFARQKGIKTAIDNTYATPIFQNPAEFGIDYVMHSCTKYIGGHSDVLAGAICCSEADMKPIIKNEVSLVTSALSPFNAWLLMRGIRTLKLRLDRHQKSANEVAGWLEEQTWVSKVNHLGLPSYSQKELFQKQMRGSGGLFSIVPKNQSQDAIDLFLETLHLFGIGVSWGGFESLVVTANVSASHLNEETKFIRFFTGLEDTRDLIADLKHAAQVAFGA